MHVDLSGADIAAGYADAGLKVTPESDLSIGQSGRCGHRIVAPDDMNLAIQQLDGEFLSRCGQVGALEPVYVRRTLGCSRF